MDDITNCAHKLNVICSVPAGKLNDTSDPQELKDQVKRIFDEWIQISEEQPSDDSHDSFVAGLQQIGFLKVAFS